MSGHGAATGVLFHIETYGCQMNVYDSAAIEGILVGAGLRAADDVDDAEVILLNTCSVRDHAEHRIHSRVGELRRRQRDGGPARVIGICGCMAERLGEDLLDRRKGFDLAVGVDGYARLPGLIAAALARQAPRAVTGHDADVHYVAPPEAYPTNNSHLVTIHKGCDYKCTYCIVPSTRGPQVEKAPGRILDEIRGIVAANGREVTLLGQNVTAYHWTGEGPELDFADLLRKVATIDGLRRIRFLTGHPRDMHDKLLRTLATEGKACPALHVPMQSGSDRILRRMKRLYRRDEYLAMVEHARLLVPDVTFSGDFMVGFPGETEADFAATLEAVRAVEYDQLFLFKYSERPGVPAVRFGDDVTDETKKRRLAEVMALQDEVWHGLADAQVGDRVRVALEGPARDEPGRWRGRTANNRKVVVPLSLAAVGDELEVEITGWRHSTFQASCIGKAR